MKKIFFVIPTFNRKDYVRRVLTDIRNQEIGGFEIYTVMVIDGSDDGTSEMINQEFPDVQCIYGTGAWWYTRSMNEGFKQACNLGADLVLTMNDDVRLETNYVKNIFNAWEKNGKNCIMGSISLTVNEPFKITFSGVKKIRWWRYKQVNYISPFTEVNPNELSGSKKSVVLPGRGMLIPVYILKELNFFDKKLVQYGSDDDFCLRAQKKGYPVFVSYDSVVFSHVEMTGAGNPINKGSVWSLLKSFTNKYSSRHLKKTAKMVKRHGGIFLLPITMPIVILGSLKAHLKYKG